MLSDARFGGLAAGGILKENGFVDNAVCFFVLDNVWVFFTFGDIAKNGIAFSDGRARQREAIFVERIRDVGICVRLFKFGGVGLPRRGVRLGICAVCSGTAKASVNGAFVEQQRIFLVVAAKAHDGNNRLCARR